MCGGDILLFRLETSLNLCEWYVMQLPGALSRPQARKSLKISTPKKFLIFQEMELSNSKIEKFPIFSQKKTFLIFPEM